MVTDSDTVVCGSNMLLRLAKYTVDMTRTMARRGILFRQLTNMDTISSPSSDQQPHNTNIHWIPASQGIALFSHRFKSLRSFFSSYFFFLMLCSEVWYYWYNIGIVYCTSMTSFCIYDQALYSNDVLLPPLLDDIRHRYRYRHWYTGNGGTAHEHRTAVVPCQ